MMSSACTLASTQLLLAMDYSHHRRCFGWVATGNVKERCACPCHVQLAPLDAVPA